MRPATQSPHAELTNEAQEVLDLVADLLFVEGLRLPRGLEVRRRMAGGDRERKRQLLQSLVPQHLTRHGAASEDSYSLTPLGTLRCKHARYALALAAQLHGFSKAVFASGKDRFTWDELKQSLPGDGTELKDSDVEVVSYVLFCLGVWGRSGNTWSLPRAERLEDLLEEQHDARWLFLRVHEDLLSQQETIQAIEQRRRILLNDEDGPDKRNSGLQDKDHVRPSPDPKTVFVIHGRNTKARDEMGTFLRACGLKPINFGDLRAELGGTPTIDGIVEEGMARAQGVVALFTADEYASLRPSFRAPGDHGPQVERWQARPNVIFEAGMAFGKDRSRVIFVLLGNPELFTDVAGVHVLRPTNVASGDRTVLRDTLRKGIGCKVEDSSDWMTAGDFEGCVRTLGEHPRNIFRLETVEPEVRDSQVSNFRPQWAAVTDSDFLGSQRMLKILLKDGQTFFESHLATLRRRLLDGRPTEIIVVHPDSPQIGAIAAMDPYKSGASGQRADCLAAIRTMQDLHRELLSSGIDISRFVNFLGHMFIPTWSGCIGDAEARISWYFTRPHRGALLTATLTRNSLEGWDAFEELQADFHEISRLTKKSGHASLFEYPI